VIACLVMVDVWAVPRLNAKNKIAAGTILFKLNISLISPPENDIERPDSLSD